MLGALCKPAQNPARGRFRPVIVAESFHTGLAAVILPSFPRIPNGSTPMLHGLSRVTLNIIIFLCLLLISWIHLSGRDPEQQPLEPLPLPPLHAAGWQHWPNNEQVSVWLRAGGSLAGGWLTLYSQQQQQTLALPANNWRPAVQAALPSLPHNEPAVLLLSGPWPLPEQQFLAALVVRELQLQPLPGPAADWPHCVYQHPAGALWLGQQLGLDWLALGDLPQALTTQPLPALPTREQWAQWRLQHSRQLRQQWQDEQGQIDIQAALAYHRLPAEIYQQLYSALSDAPKTAPAALLACLNPSAP